MLISFNNTFNLKKYKNPNTTEKDNVCSSLCSACPQENNKRTDKGRKLPDYLKNSGYISSINFSEEYEKKYKGRPLSHTVLSALKNKDCYINQGSKNVTFDLPYLDSYIIRMPKSLLKDFSLKKLAGMKPKKDDYPDINVGQAVMENGQRVQICKKQKGLPISSCDWAVVKANPDVVTQEKALAFLSDMEELAEFPIESFRDLIRDLKQIDKHEIDYLNPNNFLIDKETQKISRVDVTDFPEENITPCTKENIIFPLINVFVHSYFYDKLDEEGKSRLDAATIKVIEKCNKASEQENLLSYPQYITDYWREKIIGFMGEDKLKELQSDIDKTVNRYYKILYK